MAVRSKRADTVSYRERTLIKIMGAARIWRQQLESYGGELLLEKDPDDRLLLRLMAELGPRLMVIDDLVAERLKDKLRESE